MKKNALTDSTFWGMGRVTVMKGSKVVDLWSHYGQVTIERYWPDIRSVIIDWLRLMCEIQL